MNYDQKKLIIIGGGMLLATFIMSRASNAAETTASAAKPAPMPKPQQPVTGDFFSNLAAGFFGNNDSSNDRNDASYVPPRPVLTAPKGYIESIKDTADDNAGPIKPPVKRAPPRPRLRAPIRRPRSGWASSRRVIP